MLTVSNYHYIREDFAMPFPSIFGLTPVAFKEHIQLLSQYGTFITPCELIENQRDVFSSTENFLLLTFDDGLKEQFRLALPIMEEMGLQALFFINSINHIEKEVSLVHKIHLVRSVVPPDEIYREIIHNTGEPLPTVNEKALAFYRFDDQRSAIVKYYLNVLMEAKAATDFINPIFEKHFNESEVVEKLYMDTKEIKYLIKHKMAGSHTHSHLPLGIYSASAIESEMVKTIDFLVGLGAPSVDFISYPYGTPVAVGEKVARIAKKSGHSFGFTTQKGINREFFENPLLLNRFDCNDLVNNMFLSS